jgi:hypothetical protein
LFCEQLGYNLLWLWFLDRKFSEGSFNHSIFAKNYGRLRIHEGSVAAVGWDISREMTRPQRGHFPAGPRSGHGWFTARTWTRTAQGHGLCAPMEKLRTRTRSWIGRGHGPVAD